MKQEWYQNTSFYAHLCRWWLHSLRHVPQPLCPGQHPSVHPLRTSLTFSSSLPNSSCSPLPAVIWLCAPGARDSSVAVISLTISALLRWWRGGRSCWAWLKLTDKKLSRVQKIHWFYPISQSAQSPLPSQSLPSSQTSVMGFYPEITVLQWYMDQTALDNSVHAKVFIRCTLWFVWQILHQEKYLYLILPDKLHVCYDLPQKASLLLCFSWKENKKLRWEQ